MRERGAFGRWGEASDVLGVHGQEETLLFQASLCAQLHQKCLQGRDMVVSISLKPITKGFGSQVLADAVGPLQLGLPSCEMGRWILSS